MQISAGQDGIQRLLKAEQEAQSIVTAARKGKADLKQALHLKVQDFCCEHSALLIASRAMLQSNYVTSHRSMRALRLIARDALLKPF